MEPAGSAGGASLPSSTDRAVSAQGATSGRVWFGTCGWTDDSILRCGRFYPAGVKTAEQRLEVYGRHFPCVEVDSSTYAIPRPNATASWAARVPKGFRFHFKAFGLFCNRSCPFSALPWEAKQRLRGPDGAAGAGGAETVSLEELGAEVEAVVWEVFHACLEPVIKAQRMGAVVFQFQLGVKPGPEARRHVEHCRRMLSPRLPMAVEFRNRAWFADAAASADTAAWLASLQPAGGVSLVAADELRHETYVNSRTAAGGAVRPEILPIAMEVCDPRYVYVRLHRREGTRERLLGQDEAQAWSARLEAVAPKLSGPVYFLIGTDWEDAPITNARLLEAALPPQLRYGWKAALAAAAAARPGSIHAMLAKGGKGGGGRSAAAAEAGGSGSACTSSAPPAVEPAGPGRAEGAPPSEAAAEAAPSGQAAAGDPGEPLNVGLEAGACGAEPSAQCTESARPQTVGGAGGLDGGGAGGADVEEEEVGAGPLGAAAARTAAGATAGSSGVQVAVPGGSGGAANTASRTPGGAGVFGRSGASGGASGRGGGRGAGRGGGGRGSPGKGRGGARGPAGTPGRGTPAAGAGGKRTLHDFFGAAASMPGGAGAGGGQAQGQGQEGGKRAKGA